MKKFVLSVTTIIVVLSVLTLCGCETTVNLEETTTRKAPSVTAPHPTAVVDVTNEEGTVLATETVTLTMSAQDQEEEKNFFVPATQSSSHNSASNDRIQQALQQQQALQNQSKPDDEKVTGEGQQTEEHTTEKNSKPETNKEDKTTNPSNDTNTKKPQSNEKETQAATTEVAETVPFVQDDAAVMRSDQYMITARLVDSEGVSGTYKIAKNGKRSSVSLVYNEVPMIVILAEEEWYVLSVTDKTYVTIPKEMIKESASDQEMADILMDDPFNFEREIVSETTETIDGINYRVVEYVDGNKDYFIGKTIIKTTATDNSVMYYDTVSAFAPESLFVPPADYTETEVNQENAAEIVSSIDPSAVVTTVAPTQASADVPAEAAVEPIVEDSTDDE